MSYAYLEARTFSKSRSTKARRDLVAGELAGGRNPADALRALANAPNGRPEPQHLGGPVPRLAHRHRPEHEEELPHGTAEGGETFGDRDPKTITVEGVATWVSGLAEKHKPGTVQLYLLTFRLLLDYAQAEPNPARDSRVKLPKHVREEPNPPSAEHVEGILEALGEKWRLLFVTIEQGALRLGEAVGLRWADVDVAGLRLRLPRFGDEA
jgi:hypothetical protein